MLLILAEGLLVELGRGRGLLEVAAQVLRLLEGEVSGLSFPDSTVGPAGRGYRGKLRRRAVEPRARAAKPQVGRIASGEQGRLKRVARHAAALRLLAVKSKPLLQCVAPELLG